MGADRIEGRDVYGDAWEATCCAGPRDSVAWIEFDGNSATMSKDDAARLGLFLLDAAGIDLVGAARKVEASRIAMHSADTEDELRDAMAARSRAMGALSAELAKLEGGA